MSNRSEESDGRAGSREQGDSQGKDEGICGGSFMGGGTVLKKGPWTSAEDAILIEYVKKHGEGNWNAVQKHSGLSRCGKSCRLRWANHLRPNLKKGAFTAEEEQKIIELHAKMGNKWAKMASFLPGRTDNEIKNYWNTRIKRRQRAGLPLYPPELANPDFNENQPDQATSGFDGGDKWQDELLQPNNCIPDIMFNGYKPDQAAIPFPPNLPEMSVGNFISQGLGSLNSGCLIQGNFPKRLRESEALLPRYASSACVLPTFLQYPNGNSESARLCSFNFPYDPDPGSKNLPPLAGTFPGSHALPNGNFSASPSLVGNMKSELPSLQYPALDPSSWFLSPSVPPLAETDIGSPITTESIQSECVSPRNSGLLEALLYESNVLSHPKNQLPEKSSSSSIAAVSGVVDSTALDPCDSGWDICDTMSPLGCSATSVFSECTPPNSGGSLEEIPHVVHVKLEDEEPLHMPAKEKKISQPDLSRPDALLAFSWCSNGATDRSSGDLTASFLGEYLSDSKPPKSVASSPSSEGWALGSYSWNNMPPVCQVPDFP